MPGLNLALGTSIITSKHTHACACTVVHMHAHAPETRQSNDTKAAELVNEVFVHRRLRFHEQLVEPGGVATLRQELAHASWVVGQVAECDGACHMHLFIV